MVSAQPSRITWSERKHTGAVEPTRGCFDWSKAMNIFYIIGVVVVIVVVAGFFGLHL
jgi:hypothetical protein